MKNIKDNTSILYWILIIINSLIIVIVPTISWFMNPELTNMQIVIKYWFLYASLVLLISIGILFELLIEKK